MEIERIRVDGLFGRFNHEVVLARPEKIAIIHAPNGFGKTVLLTLVDAFFARRFELFTKYQFSKFTITFSNGERVEVEKREDPSLIPRDESEQVQRVTVTAGAPGAEHEPYHLRSAADLLPNLERYMPFLERVGADRWVDERTDELLTTAEVVARYEFRLPPNARKRIEIPDWLRRYTDAIDCRLIETQRLLRIGRTGEAFAGGRRSSQAPTAVVEAEARDLADRIGKTLAEYANSSQLLDQSFPGRVIGALGSWDPPNAEEVSSRLEDLANKRTALIDAGLLDRAGAPSILTEAELEGIQIRRVMSVYLEDMEQKLSRFDELYDRVSLFQQLLTEKFQFKRVVVSRERGISIRTDDDRQIQLTDLSSGEQHELVLLYELLFGVRDDALILIDEPELSLHVGWQMRFLPDLLRIQSLKPLQIIMATHSPQIINDRWDLTVELKR